MATILAMRAPRKTDPAPVTAVQDDPASGQAPAATRKSSGTGDPAAQPTRGDYVVQLASFSSPQGAERGRTTLQRRLSDLLSGADMFVAEATLADTRTVYRVRMGPFASLAEARDTCARFRAHSHDCLVMQ
jgi:cell division septation protein DedD